MKPYKFQPYLKTTIWGGYQIAPFKGIFNAQPNVGESWEISGVPAYRTSYDSTKPTSQLINCPYFVVHRVVVQVAQQIDFHCDSFVIVVCLWGKANINGIEIRQGETILVPACENILYIFGNATFLTATM
jgi:mannose-6-phosphate isomerase class I